VSAIRPETIAKIDALHAKIAALIEAEKKYYFRTQGRINSLWDSIHETQIEWHANSPAIRAAGEADMRRWDGYVRSKPYE